jgi:hypothetical protein
MTGLVHESLVHLRLRAQEGNIQLLVVLARPQVPTVQNSLTMSGAP